jgi:hypothetical protein
MINVQLYQHVFRVQSQFVEPGFDPPKEPPHIAAEGFEQAALLHQKTKHQKVTSLVYLLYQTHYVGRLRKEACSSSIS